MPRRMKYKEYWKPAVIDMIRHYSTIQGEDTIQANIFASAIKKALKDAESLPDGGLRVQAVKMYYIDNTHKIDGIAMEVNASPRTVQRWLNSFVNAVGVNAGYK